MTIEKRYIGWMCSMVPEEIIFSTGMEPVRIVDIFKKHGPSSEIFPSNFCSLVKGYIDSMFDSHGKKLDGLVVTPSCNATEFLYDAVKYSKVVNYVYMLDVPRKRDKEAVHFFAEQLRIFANSLENIFNVHIKEESLLKAIILFNSIRKNMDILRQARLNGFISGVEYFNLVIAAAVKNKENVLKETNAAIEAISYKEINKNKKKILLTGTPLLNSNLIDCIESTDAVVFLDDLCTSGTYMGCQVNTEGDPFYNLAFSYLQNRICTRMDCKLDRINHVKDMLDKYNPDGVIYNLSKFRVTDCYDSIALNEDVFDEKRPPFMVIENENNGDLNLTTITKIETFMELLSER